MSNNSGLVHVAQTNDVRVAAIIQQLTDWHASRVSQLQEIAGTPPEQLCEIQYGDECIQLTAEMHIGLKLGLHIALMQLGRLPISLYTTNDKDNNDEQPHHTRRF